MCGGGGGRGKVGVGGGRGCSEEVHLSGITENTESKSFKTYFNDNIRCHAYFQGGKNSVYQPALTT